MARCRHVAGRRYAAAVPRTSRKRPNELTPEWPSTPSEVLAGEYARRFALRLRDVIGEDSVRALARDADVAPGAIRKILEGQTWPDLRTIAKLESTLGTVLWPTAPEGDSTSGVRYHATTSSASWWQQQRASDTDGTP